MARRTAAAYLAFIFPLTLAAQRPVKDFQFWQNAEMEYNLDKRKLLHVQVQTRFTENASDFTYYYYDVGGLYRITRNLRLAGDYILVRKQELDGNYSTRHQYNIYATARKRMGHFVFFYRFLHEAQLKDYNRSEGGNTLQNFYLRNKLNLRYKVNKRFTPYVSNEVFHQLDGRDFERGFKRNRVSAGLLYNLSDTWQLDGFYMVQWNRNDKIPSNEYVVGIGITRNFFQ